METSKHTPLKKRFKKGAQHLFLLIFVTTTVLYWPSVANRAQALPPFTFTDLSHLYISENYRDDGRGRQLEDECPAPVGGSASTVANTGQMNATVWNYFANKGLAAHQIAGIIGNLQHESGLNPAAVNPSSGAYGLFQFVPPSKYFRYADSIGAERSDPTVQLDYVWGQLNNDAAVAGSGYLEGPAFAKLQATTTVEEAARSWAQDYERFRARGMSDTAYEAEIQARADDAQGAYVLNGGEAAAGDESESADGCSGAAAASDDDDSAEETEKTDDTEEAETVKDGTTADFVSSTLRQAGKALRDGVNEWQYSSVSSLEEFYENTEGYSLIDPLVGAAQIGDVAFIKDPSTGKLISGIVQGINILDGVTIRTLDESGLDTTQTYSFIEIESGLRGFGRELSETPKTSSLRKERHSL